MKITTFASAVEVSKEALSGAAAVVIDVLRMTSAATTMMANGAKKLKLIADETEAREEAKKERALLGGERKGLRLPGFYFGNSPLEYSRENVQNETVVMTTSNGARAVEAAFGAKRILLCSLLNVSAVADKIRNEEKVVILCAGTKDRFSLDDAVCAGALAERLKADKEDDLTIALRYLYKNHEDELAEFISNAAHLQYLRTIGFAADLDFCLREDVFTHVPEISEDGWFY